LTAEQLRGFNTAMGTMATLPVHAILHLVRVGIALIPVGVAETHFKVLGPTAPSAVGSRGGTASKKPPAPAAPRPVTAPYNVEYKDSDEEKAFATWKAANSGIRARDSEEGARLLDAANAKRAALKKKYMDAAAARSTPGGKRPRSENLPPPPPPQGAGGAGGSGVNQEPMDEDQ
jgi:hypothetical protein